MPRRVRIRIPRRRITPVPAEPDKTADGRVALTLRMDPRLLSTLSEVATQANSNVETVINVLLAQRLRSPTKE